MPSRSRICATSCGWTPSTSKLTIPARLAGGGPQVRDARDLGELVERVGDELVLVLLDRLEPDLLEVVDRGAEADGLRHRRGARLELVRQLAPRRLVLADAADHVAADQERLHREQQLGLAPEEADAARPAASCGR